MSYPGRTFGMAAVVLAAELLAAGCAWIQRVSVDFGDGDPNGCSVCSGTAADISSDGRYIVFSSVASDLVPGDGNGTDDIFRRDLLTGTTVRVSVDTGGGDPNGNSNNPSLSADGRYVAFVSAATDLVPGDSNGANDVFVRDLQVGSTARVSVNVFGGDFRFGGEPSISADGRYVAFSAGVGLPNVFRRDLEAGTTTQVSVDTGGGGPISVSTQPSISADGRYVAFSSADLDLGGGTGTWDVFRRDLEAGTTTRLSVGDVSRPSISGDGSYVVFSSFAALVPGDGNATRDVYLWDVAAGTTTRVSVDTGGGDPNAYSDNPSISDDGRYVVFHSLASNLVSGDSNGIEDVFVRDRVLGRTILLSRDLFHGQANGASVMPRVSRDGRYVAFRSDATNLVPDDANGVADVFIKYTRVVTVSGISPNTISRGSTKRLVITGTGFESGSTLSIPRPTADGGTIMIRRVRVVSDTKITALVSVPADASVGDWDILVWHPPTALGPTRVAAGQCSDCLQVVA